MFLLAVNHVPTVFQPCFPTVFQPISSHVKTNWATNVDTDVVWQYLALVSSHLEPDPWLNVTTGCQVCWQAWNTTTRNICVRLNRISATAVHQDWNLIWNCMWWAAADQVCQRKLVLSFLDQFSLKRTEQNKTEQNWTAEAIQFSQKKANPRQIPNLYKKLATQATKWETELPRKNILKQHNIYVMNKKLFEKCYANVTVIA